MRYEVVAGDVHPYFDRYGSSSRATLFCEGMTSHFYLAVRGCSEQSAELEEILTGEVSISCTADSEGLYVELRVGRLTPLTVRVRHPRLMGAPYPLVELEEVLEGTAIQFHVVSIPDGIVLATREVGLTGATTRMLYGAIDRYRAVLAGEGNGARGSRGGLRDGGVGASF